MQDFTQTFRAEQGRGKCQRRLDTNEKKVYIKTDEKVLDRVNKKNKQRLREEIFKAIDQREMIHNKIHSTKFKRRKSKRRLEYKMKERVVKRRASEDKRG